ncbi:MAG: hypothetical protein PWP28_2517 [Oceanotoga sp.]|nr:hypothetical protein [Oceanotoga sp.]
MFERKALEDAINATLLAYEKVKNEKHTGGFISLA